MVKCPTRCRQQGGLLLDSHLTRSHTPVSALYRLITRAGAPTATQKSGIERLTTELAPMTQCLPMVTPGRTTTFSPSHASRPMVTGAIRLIPCSEMGEVIFSKIGRAHV